MRMSFHLKVWIGIFMGYILVAYLLQLITHGRIHPLLSYLFTGCVQCAVLTITLYHRNKQMVSMVGELGSAPLAQDVKIRQLLLLLNECKYIGLHPASVWVREAFLGELQRAEVTSLKLNAHERAVLSNLLKKDTQILSYCRVYSHWRSSMRMSR
jgi:cell division protein FtsL